MVTGKRIGFIHSTYSFKVKLANNIRDINFYQTWAVEQNRFYFF